MELENLKTFSEVACTVDKDIKEIIGGEIIYMSPTSPLHNKLVRRLATKLDNSIPNLNCEVYTENVAVNIPEEFKKSPRDYIQPDVFVACCPQWKGLFCKTVPCLIIEVLSTSTKEDIIRDKETKRKLYQSIGVKEFIIVGQEGTIVVFNLEEDGLYSETIYAHRISKGIIFKSKYLLGVEIDVEELYKDLI
ncbi:MAG: Uma2 family endonuclease [Anaeroplasmataceae bacterium]